ILTPCLRQRGHGQEWVRAVDYTTTQRQHSQGNRPDVLGTSDLSSQTRGTLCRNNHVPVVIILCASPTLTGPLPPRPHWATENTTLPGGHIERRPQRAPGT
ncbi:hypothetical protein AVEN_258798-1, partial [Araneus ventricosus]